MNMETLETFITVSETKNFRRAAELLHVSQSTITTRIKTIETLIGKTLLERNTRSVSLTQAGRTFLPFAQRMSLMFQDGLISTRLQGQYEHSLVIGGSHSIMDYFLYPAVEEFRTLRPDVSVSLVSAKSQDVFYQIVDRSVDMGVLYDHIPHPDIKIVPIKKSKMCLVASPSLRMSEPITPEYFNQLSYIYLNWGLLFSEWHEGQFGKHYLPQVRVSYTSLLLKYLLDGRGVGFVIEEIAKDYVREGQLQQLTLAHWNPLPEHTFYLVYPKNLPSPICRDWIDFLMEKFQVNA